MCGKGAEGDKWPEVRGSSRRTNEFAQCAAA